MRMQLGAASVAAVLIGAGAAFSPVPALSQQIQCGGDYRVVGGDTLSEIAVRAYGAGRFGPIFEANRSRVRTPQTLEVGVDLFIPCLDGTGNPLPRGVGAPAAAAAPVPAESEPEVETASLDPTTSPTFLTAPQTEVARLAATNDVATAKLLAVQPNAPFVGPKLPEGGMLTEIVQRALLRAPVPIEFDVTYEGGQDVTDVAAGGFDLGYPVARPNCANPAALDDVSRTLCQEFVFSDPIYSAGIGMFVTTDGDFGGADTAQDLFGSRICRPEGMGTGDLAGVGLVAPNVNPVLAKTVEECFQLLSFGDVNVVSVPVPEGEAAMQRLGITSRVRTLSSIGEGQTMHVVAPRQSENGSAFIAVINGGLAEMRRAGSYDAIVQNHLAFAGIN
ncbi:MAG: transporter substrate-binding domain-containing protein [Pseudomonadota bacterium]